MKDRFTSRDVMEIADVTYRQVNNWAASDIVKPSLRPPSGSGTPVEYSLADVQRAVLVAQMVKAGLAMATVRTALNMFEVDDDGMLTGVFMSMIPGVTVTVAAKKAQELAVQRANAL